MHSVRRGSAKLVRIGVALLAALPVAGFGSFATDLMTAHAGGAVCYWSNFLTDTTTRSDYAYNVTLTSKVVYQNGLDCNLNLVQTYVYYYNDSMTVSASDAVSHGTTSWYLCEYTDISKGCQGVAGSSWTPIRCSGSCTVTRYGYPKKYMNYNIDNFDFEHYYGCDVHGGTWCETRHFFQQHKMTILGLPSTP